MFCCNLRNKQYCFGNQQLTQEQYEQKKAEWDLSSRAVYERAKGFFAEMMLTMAWHRALEQQQTEDVHGNYITESKSVENGYFVDKVHTAVNVLRGYDFQDTLDCVSPGLSQLTYLCCFVGLQAYEVRFSFSCYESHDLEYCAFCQNCENCFGCVGLRGKQYYIFNKPYSEEAYHALKAQLVEYMKSTGEYGQFFPGYFSPAPYDETISGYYWPLDKSQQEQLGFRYAAPVEKHNAGYRSVEEIPDTPEGWTDSMYQHVYWDEVAGKPFQITKQDVAFAKKMGVPLPDSHYMRRIQENLRWMPFDGKLRTTTCAQSGKTIETSWPAAYDGRILSEEAYNQMVV
ncbi:hypothetical protein H6771_00815 [Candidatus Peribacteria bacterium]|nr:hypothetical protein [Candidatus Peribacteria bacterium]